jgi:hypothetical protein
MNRMNSIALCCALGAALHTACILPTGVSDPADPHVDASSIFSTTAFSVFSVRPSWSPDASAVVFSGNLATNASNTTIWKVSASAMSTPVVLGGDAAYCPSYLSNGMIVYYTGWIGTDLDMHIMTASPAQSAGSFTANILHSFNGSDVGKTLNSAHSPEEMSVSDDSSRAFMIWAQDSAYVLRWNAADSLIQAYKVESQIYYGTISPDGTKIAYTNTSGKVVWMPSEGGVEHVISTGHYPTWDATSTKIGYTNGTVYEVYNLSSSSSTFFKLEGAIQHPALSPSGHAIVYRTFGGNANGLALGVLTQ